MPEVWLHTNRRPLLLGMFLPALVVLAGGALIVGGMVPGWKPIVLIAGILVTLGGLFLLANLVYWLRVPRLAYERGELLIHVAGREPIRVPIEIVEVFFLGQGAATLPPQQGRETETTNVVVRLAEAASEWKHRDVDPRLGMWCESYVTLNGAWCEQISEQQMGQLNQRLIAAHREQKRLKAEASA